MCSEAELLEAADNYVRQIGCICKHMDVVNIVPFVRYAPSHSAVVSLLLAILYTALQSTKYICRHIKRDISMALVSIAKYNF